MAKKKIKKIKQEDSLDIVCERLFAESTSLQKSMEEFKKTIVSLSDLMSIINLHVAAINEQMKILNNEE